MLRFCLKLLTLISLCASPQAARAFAQDSAQTEQEISQINREFDNAELRRDSPAIERTLADDFIWTTFAGTVFDRAQTREHLRSSDSKFELWQSDEVRIRIYGDTAVVTARLTRKGRNSRRDLSGQSRYTRVYAMRNRSWQMVAYQVTQIAEPDQNPNSRSSQNATEDEAAIRKIVADNTNAWNRRDAKALVSFLTEDTDHINVNGAWRSGRAETEKALTTALATSSITMTSSVEKLRFVTQDVAIAVIRRDYTDDKGNRQAISTSVFHRINGKWQIEAFQNAFVQPPERSSTANPRAPSAEQEILRVEEERRQAILHSDAAAMDRLLGEEFIRTDYEGRTHDKADELSLYKNNRRQTQSWEASDVNVHVYGDAAVVTESAAAKDVLDGQKRDVKFRFTHVWAKRGGRWQLVARHGSHIAEGGTREGVNEVLTAPDAEGDTGQAKPDKQLPREDQDRNPQSETEARKVIDAFNAAGNKRDLEGLRNALNFPYVRIASGKVRIARTRDEFTSDAPPQWQAEGWHHSTVDSIEFIQSSSDKVHAALVFSRYKADGTRYATYRTLRIITRQDGHWGIQCSSSFAP